MPTLRTLRNQADKQARALGHHAMSYSTSHSSAMYGECKTCGACVHIGTPTRGAAIVNTCAEYLAENPKVQTEKKRVNGRMVVCTQIGEYTDLAGRRYTAWRALHAFLNPWVRLEPFDGGRARSAYDPGKAILRQISARAQEEAQSAS
jgi:hypothetical protein